ncbi:MAG: ketoacyl-ACP synthase III [Bacteroidales bacterium]|jgi:3-oxoacyl-[acyl-carrier-protein] synthase-3|nr:ketoacyl-ACP synthase III [Bacteroidales bacterium]
MKAFIKAIDYYLPQTIVANEDLARDFPEWTVDKITDKIGVKKRHVAAEHETAVDLAAMAAQKLFAQGIDKESVDYVLFCTQSPDYYLPASACILQNRLGLSHEIGALDFNQGCSGFIYGLSLAKGLLSAGIAKNILLLTGETYSKRLHPGDKGNRSIFGDAAAAVLISLEGFAEIGEFCLGTDGSGAENLIIKTGGARSPEKANTVDFDENNNPLSPDYIYMDGSEIFSFTLRSVPVLVEKTAERNNIAKEAIDLYIFHQANKYMLDFLRKKIKIDQDKFYLYLSEVGNTVSSTIPIAMFEALKDGALHKGMKALLAGFGVGYSWGGCVVQF